MKRLKEPSTWAGIASALPILVRMFAPQWAAVADGIAMAAGAAAVAITEKGGGAQ